jgi:hypothetical protein
MSPSPLQILARFVAGGLLDPRSKIEMRGETVISILYLRATRLHAGIGRSFLRELKQAGLEVHITPPLPEALPFWRRMNEEHLVDDDPDALPSWHAHMSMLECQMKKPDWSDKT